MESMTGGNNGKKTERLPVLDQAGCRVAVEKILEYETKHNGVVGKALRIEMAPGALSTKIPYVLNSFLGMGTKEEFAAAEAQIWNEPKILAALVNYVVGKETEENHEGKMATRIAEIPEDIRSTVENLVNLKGALKIQK